VNKKTSWPARLLALIALIAAVVTVIVVIAGADLHSNSDGHGNQAQSHKQHHKKPRTTAKTYTVQSGDTLTSIAHKTGITVSELQALNPEVDPQILVAGEILKLQR